MRIALGTVQFGLAYGISNQSGRTPLKEVAAILDYARTAGIAMLDTAAAYGDAEAVLAKLDARARGFSIISKTARLAQGLEAVLARARDSVQRLGRPLEALLVHSAGDLALPDGPALWQGLQELKARGEVLRTGISAYAADTVLDLARRFQPDLMQVPVSVVDQRLHRDGTLSALAAQGVEIHARSLFHQGLIFVDPAHLPPKLAEKRAEVEALQGRIAASGLNPLALALAFACSVPAIAVAVVGVTRQSELQAIVAAAQAPQPDGDFAGYAIDDPLLLDPTRW